MIHILNYSSGDKVSFDDTNISDRINQEFKTEYVELPDGRRVSVGYLEDIAFFEGDTTDEVNWYQVSDEDDFALDFAEPVYPNTVL